MSEEEEAGEVQAEEESSPAGDSEKKEEEGESEEPTIAFASYQLFIFVSCYVFYMLILYNRKSFTFALPYVIMQEYFSTYEINMILSAQAFTYTFSKFMCSWATDHYSPRIMLTVGMFMTGFIMLAFSDQEDWANIMLLTAANGIAQGTGWPAVLNMIRAWYPPTQFGFWFACISTVDNFLGTFGSSVASSLAVSYGWRAAVQYPALVAILASALVPLLTWDKPSDCGYEDQLTLGGADVGHWSDLFGSDFLMLLASTFSMLLVVKTSCQDWGQIYLLQERGLSVYSASAYLNSMEVGGIVGCLIVGAITDYMIRKGYYYGTGKSPRMIVVQLLVAASCLFLNLFLFTIDPDTPQSYMTMLGFLMGFSMYGAISLLGTITLEVAPIHMTGCAHAIIGLCGSVGAVAAGYPINYVAQVNDWFTAFMVINGLSLAVFFILVMGKDTKATFLNQGGGPPKLKKKTETETSATS